MKEIKFNDLTANLQTLILFVVLLSMVFCVFLNVLYLQKQINDLSKRVCWNETIIKQEPIMKQIECSCAKDGCLMWCGEIIGYKNVSKEKEVCEIE